MKEAVRVMMTGSSPDPPDRLRSTPLRTVLDRFRNIIFHKTIRLLVPHWVITRFVNLEFSEYIDWVAPASCKS